MFGLSLLDQYFRQPRDRRRVIQATQMQSYLSLLPDLDQIAPRADQLFAKQGVDVGPSLNLQRDRQIALLRQLAAFYPDFDWPDERDDQRRFYLNNGTFLAADALSLHALLRHFRPNQVVAVTPGYAAALMLDVNDRHFPQPIGFTFIDPEPERLAGPLHVGDQSRFRLLPANVQDVPADIFDSLKENDFLFVDSSHISKTGSDVNHLVFEVLPRLSPGVIVHFHDIMWPFEYPRNWVQQGRAFNESYLVRAFLQYNSVFQILLFNNYAGYCLTDLVRELMPRFLENKGGSLWLQKAV